MGRGALSVVTALGPMFIEYTDHGICALQLGRTGHTTTARPSPFVRQLAADLQAYARGERVIFQAPLDLLTGTVFQRLIWDLLRQIPYGQTRTYRWLADQAGRSQAVRAAGAACGANPVPVIIPCHRILRSNGELGGFSAGLSWKQRLLALEGIVLTTTAAARSQPGGAVRPGTGSGR